MGALAVFSVQRNSKTRKHVPGNYRQMIFFRQIHRLSTKWKVACSAIVALSACLIAVLIYVLTPPFLTLGDSVKYSYSIGGSESDEVLEIESDSESYRKIQEWLKKTRLWYPDINSYVYVDKISSDRMIINVMDDRVVVNFLGGSTVKWTQYSCGIDEELRMLTDRLHESLKKRTR